MELRSKQICWNSGSTQEVVEIRNFSSHHGSHRRAATKAIWKGIYLASLSKSGYENGHFCEMLKIHEIIKLLIKQLCGRNGFLERCEYLVFCDGQVFHFFFLVDMKIGRGAPAQPEILKNWEPRWFKIFTKFEIVLSDEKFFSDEMIHTNPKVLLLLHLNSIGTQFQREFHDCRNERELL